MSTQAYIGIEGPIGVGKTTLARILGAALPAEVLLEVFEENPFLSDFYADRERYAFQTQIFFLLSRYRQQHRVIASTLTHDSLVSDYLFAKDWLFAHLNLSGDELVMYERVHAILGQQLPATGAGDLPRRQDRHPAQAHRVRDRAYERQMEHRYLDDLRSAYERYFADYVESPVLTLDTSGIDIVHDLDARAEVVSRVKTALRMDGRQLPLPDLEETPAGPPMLTNSRRLGDFQQFHRVLDREKGFIADLFLNYICLSEEIGEIGRVLKYTWRQQARTQDQVGNRQEAFDQALEAHKADLQEELADALAFLLKIANDAHIDLEAAYLQKMVKNMNRTWGAGSQEGRQ